MTADIIEDEVVEAMLELETNVAWGVVGNSIAELGGVPTTVYKFNRLGPPQYSLELPEHVMEQPVDVIIAPSLILFAQ